MSLIRPSYRIYRIQHNDHTHRDEFTLVAELPESDGWRGRPNVVLSNWFDEESPDVGTYKCEPPVGRSVILSWTGKRAAA